MTYFPKNLKIKINKIKLCHIDVNTYSDTKKIFNFVHTKVIKGGIIIFDDFGIWGGWYKKFIYKMSKIFKISFYQNYMGQCILIRNRLSVKNFFAKKFNHCNQY